MQIQFHKVKGVKCAMSVSYGLLPSCIVSPHLWLLLEHIDQGVCSTEYVTYITHIAAPRASTQAQHTHIHACTCTCTCTLSNTDTSAYTHVLYMYLHTCPNFVLIPMSTCTCTCTSHCHHITILRKKSASITSLSLSLLIAQGGCFHVHVALYPPPSLIPRPRDLHSTILHSLLSLPPFLAFPLPPPSLPPLSLPPSIPPSFRQGKARSSFHPR